MGSRLAIFAGLILASSLGAAASARVPGRRGALPKQTGAHYQQSRAARLWYLRTVAQIPALNQKMLDSRLPPRERALHIWKWRKRARLKARSLMRDRALVRKFRQRDRRLYGDPDGPSFEYLVHKARRAGLRGAAIFNEIIRNSVTTDAETNARYRIRLPKARIVEGADF